MNNAKLLENMKQFLIHLNNFASNRVVAAIKETDSLAGGLNYFRNKIAPKNVHSDLKKAEEKVLQAQKLLNEAKKLIDSIEKRASTRITELESES